MRLLVVAILMTSIARADDCHSQIMIVLDRSCSMNDPPKPGGTRTKWELAGLALQKVTTDYAGKLDFGLIMFPDQTGMNCLQDGPIYVNVGPGNESKVVSTVMSTMPTGPCVTDIKPAFDQVSTDPAFAQAFTGSGPRRFVLFISDGMQTCGGNDKAIADSIKKLYDNGYPSYIVGFGNGVDPMALDQFATAGGVPRAVSGDGGGRLYYQADDAQQLDDALAKIVGTIAAEFTVCPGVPCPDSRCFQAGTECMMGFCQSPAPSPGTTNTTGTSGGSSGGDGGREGSSSTSGCGCDLGGAATSIPMLPFLFFFAWRVHRRFTGGERNPR
jgi:hypothetical protein